MKRNSRNPSRTWSSRIPKEILVAIITGSLGLAGVIVAGYFGYVGVLIPMNATQTAQASVANINTQLPTDTPSVSPIPTSTISTSISSVVSNGIVRVSELIPGNGCYPKQLPENIDPVADPKGAVEQIAQSRDDGSILNWAYVSQIDNEFVVIYTLTNVANAGSEWVIVENTARVSIEYQPASEHSNVFDGGCGGGDWYDLFTPVFLSPKAPADTSLTTKSKQFDYFELQPGESERFELPFICSEPGLYSMNLTFKYSSNGQPADVASLGQTRVLCLRNYTEWSTFGSEAVVARELILDGNKYTQKQP